MTEIAIAIASGLATAMIIFLWQKGIVPALWSYFRRDVNVAGEWNWYEGNNPNKVGELVLQQKGHIISGTLKRTASKDGSKFDREFSVKGKIYHDFLQLEFEEILDNRRRGVINLVVSQVREVMYGRNAYIEIGTNKPVSDLFTFILSSYTLPAPSDVIEGVNQLSEKGGQLSLPLPKNYEK